MKRALAAGVLVALSTGIAGAADLQVKAPVYKAPPAIPVSSWTGLYFGGHIGGAWVNETATLTGVVGGAPTVPTGFQVNGNRSGFLGGGQVGVNWQVSNLVLGVEGDFSWTGSSASVTSPGTLIVGTSNTQNANDHWYATATGRVGYALSDWLLYVKGGGAWLNVNYSGSVTSAAGVVTVFPGLTDTRSGWTVGVGVEHAFWNNWSWKIEYDYMDFGTKSYTFANAAGTSTNFINIDTTVNVVKAGINYRFNWGGPVVARY